MSANEFAFLALGLVLGLATGAALVEVIRSRPPAPREVRLTVSPDAVPRRPPATLATGAFRSESAEVARGGPADRRGADRDTPPNDPPPGSAGSPFVPVPGVLRMGAVASGPVAGAAGAMIGIPIHRDADPATAALRRIAAATAERAMRLGTATAVLNAPSPSHSNVAQGGTVDATMAGPEPSSGAGHAAAGSAQPADSGPCAEERRVAEERCAHAGRAREQAEAAHDALRAAQRAYDDHLTRADRAAADADPRAVRAAKEAAQHAFRSDRAAATTRDGVEAVARAWLAEINRINTTARDAAVQLDRERSGATALVTEIERLTVAADAARIGAEVAERACLDAREAVAVCQESANAPVASLAVPARTSDPGSGASGGSGARRDEGATGWDDEDEAAIALATGRGEPAILRILRGDRAVLHAIATALADDDPAEQRRWTIALSGLVEAIVARAIEASALDFPTEHPFWGPFTRSQNRDISAALSSLGYRFDGLGGWVDGRVPSQRDLSLAVGYAGLDPMRIRHWPNETEMADLFREVSVAADEYLGGAAGGLTLGELVTVLGLRADALTDLWNEWGRVRPLLLAGT